MGRTKTQSRTRLTLSLTTATRRRLAALTKACDHESLSETVRHALALYEQASVHVRGGGRVVLSQAGEPDVILSIGVTES